MTTDGIIQKVFKISMRKHNDPYMDNVYDTWTHEDLKTLQQELIEEIKKLFPDSPFRHSNAFIISRLIGDNEK